MAQLVEFAVAGSEIINCINYGDIVHENVNANGKMGGIVGIKSSYGECIINNCKNYGKSPAGIIGVVKPGGVTLLNCANYGECDYGLVKGFNGGDWNVAVELNIKNSFNVGNSKKCGMIGDTTGVYKSITINMENCYNFGESPKAIIEAISTYKKDDTTINIKNTYYDTSKCLDVGAITEGIETVSIYNNSDFVKKLNDNIGTNSEWKKWKMGNSGYPVFE